MSERMPALSLWQPWATLIAVGAKRIETRHWAAPPSLIGRTIGIHAAKRKTELGLRELEPFASALAGAGELPLGAVVATAVLDRCPRMTGEAIARLEALHPAEAAFGLYEPSRYAWVLRDVNPLPEPIPWRGGQGIFWLPEGWAQSTTLAEAGA